jgi:uncharacterized membrane protein YbaN (DUF454 family)
MRELWFIIGLFALILGTIGIVLPILPTTPFFLVTTYSLTKSSPKVHDWITSKTFFQKHLSNLTMTRTKKWTLLLLVDTLLVVYVILFNVLYLRIIILLTILVKHIVFHKYVTVKE